jgi:hypothetical protein
MNAFIHIARFRKDNVEVKRILELESELEYTKKALNLTKSSVCIRVPTIP